MKLPIRIKRIFTFDSAHYLPGHYGKCAGMHGHTYKLEVTVARNDRQLIVNGSSEGMVMDFTDLNRIVKEEIIDKVDHKILNEVFDFRTTSENLALHFFQVISGKLEQYEVVVHKIALWETPNSCVEVGDER